MISAIIPVYNEEEALVTLLPRLGAMEGLEVIVVDGASTDATYEVAGRYAVKLLTCGRGRWRQLNEGVHAASGEVLWFLHADTVPQGSSVAAIEKAMREGCLGGCFSQKIDADGAVYRAIEVSGNIRARWSRIFYGDQGIFVRKDAFALLGGFEQAGLFEDVIFSKKLRNLGKTCVLDVPLLVSARRWEHQGVMRTTVLNWLLRLGFMLGIPADTLRNSYQDIRR